MEEINQAYWSKRWTDNLTGWDIGHVSTPIKEYIDQLQNKDLRILIPGCGNSYEAEYLHKNGFNHVSVIDIVQEPLSNLQSRIPDFPSDNLICQDFFHHQGEYDLILEQTFFCALNPNLRTDYVRKMHNLLSEKGKIAGLLFNVPLNTEHPPFGGDVEEYKSLFDSEFHIKTLEQAYNSIKPREEKEVFIIFEKNNYPKFALT